MGHLKRKKMQYVETSNKSVEEIVEKIKEVCAKYK